MMHQFMSEDEGVSCLTCGSYYGEARHDAGVYGSCSGRTDLVHGHDTSSHSLDNCAAYDAEGHCEHTDFECDCDLEDFAWCLECGDRIDFCQGHGQLGA